LGTKTGLNSLQLLFLVIGRVLGVGCYMSGSGVLHDFGSYHESTWASDICGAHTCLHSPPKGSYAVPYCPITAIYGVDDVAYSI
jgi:hypothetical protein